MNICKSIVKELIKVTSLAAVATYNFIGKKDKDGADKAAVDIMRKELNKIEMDGKVVIGEGELDEAPMLYIGEKLGTGNGIKLDIAVDPVEGTNFVSKNLPGGISVLAVSESGNLLNAPETYMDKISFASDFPDKCIDLDYSIEKNINNISDFRKKPISDVSVCLLDRPRHKEIINKLLNLKVKVKLISDGDVSGSLLVADPKNNIDLFLGIGGGPEGVLAACALDAYNCKFQGRFLFKTNEDIHRAKKMGISDLNKKYEISEIVKGESVFCATGITSSDLVKGVKIENNKFITETLVTHKNFSNNIIKSEIAKT